MTGLDEDENELLSRLARCLSDRYDVIMENGYEAAKEVLEIVRDADAKRAGSLLKPPLQRSCRQAGRCR